MGDTVSVNLNRARLLALIRDQQGIHRSALVRSSGLSWGTVYHHVACLHRLRLIRQLTVHGRICLMTNDAASLTSQPALLLPAAARILDLLQENGTASPTAIAKQLNLGPKTVRRHLDALSRAGLVASDACYHPRFRLAEPLGAQPAAPLEVSPHLQA